MSENPYLSPATNPSTTHPTSTLRIRRIGARRLGKILGVLHFLISAIVVVPLMLFATLVGGDIGVDALGLLITPVLSGLGGVLSGCLGGFLYNTVAGWIGGIELEIER